MAPLLSTWLGLCGSFRAGKRTQKNKQEGLYNANAAPARLVAAPPGAAVSAQCLIIAAGSQQTGAAGRGAARGAADGGADGAAARPAGSAGAGPCGAARSGPGVPTAGAEGKSVRAQNRRSGCTAPTRVGAEDCA